jgi:hypothetical protein
MDVFRALLHDSPGAGTAVDLGAHRALLDRPDGWAVGPLVVGDERLAGLDDSVALSVLTSGGAGALTALARRAGGLPGNAARVVAAAAELPDGVEVLVGLPAGTGLVDAVELVEAAGLQGRLDLSAHRGAAEQLSVLVEADLAFKVTGLGTDTFGPYGVVAVLMAVEALVDGAEAEDAEQLLAEPDENRSRNALSVWDEALQARVRRRLRGVDCVDVAATLDRLAEAGLLDGGASGA